MTKDTRTEALGRENQLRENPAIGRESYVKQYVARLRVIAPLQIRTLRQNFAAKTRWIFQTKD